MKHRVSFICALVSALCLCLALSGCGGAGAYQPKELSPSVASPVIGQDGTLRVGVDGDGGAPFVASSGTPMTGLDIDLAAALANQLGLKLSIVNVGADAESALENGEVDIVMGQSSSDESKTVWISDPYLQTGVALFAGSGNTTVPTRDSSPVIAAQSSSTSEWAVENAFGESAVMAASDLTSAFSSVETGKAAYVAVDAVIGSYAALYQNVDVSPVALLGSVGGYCIGVSADNADLQKAVADALSAISGNGVASVVSTKWLGGAIDLSALPVIETTSSKSPSDTTSGEDETNADESDGSSTTTDESIDTDGSTAGANAVIPGQAA